MIVAPGEPILFSKEIFFKKKKVFSIRSIYLII